MIFFNFPTVRYHRTEFLSGRKTDISGISVTIIRSTVWSDPGSRSAVQFSHGRLIRDDHGICPCSWQVFSTPGKPTLQITQNQPPIRQRIWSSRPHRLAVLPFPSGQLGLRLWTRQEQKRPPCQVPIGSVQLPPPVPSSMEPWQNPWSVILLPWHHEPCGPCCP